MLLMLLSHAQQAWATRCFTNTIEQIFGVLAFYYYLLQGDRFTLSTIKLTVTITTSFMARNTSAVISKASRIEVRRAGSFFRCWSVRKSPTMRRLRARGQPTAATAATRRVRWGGGAPHLPASSSRLSWLARAVSGCAGCRES